MYFSDLKYSFLLFSLQGNSRYSIISIKTNLIQGKCCFFRTSTILKDINLDIESGGMAEGLTSKSSQLLALAEAYEKLCLHENKTIFDANLPFGVGCGGKKNSAKNRALGEYYERTKVSQIKAGSIPLNEFLIEQTIKKGVYVAFTKDENLNIGSGYGLSKKEAQISALKSLKRKQDFQVKPHIFKIPKPGIEKKFKFITPAKKPWLECALYYHQSDK